MNDIKKNKDQSPLVQSVLSLDDHFSQLERLSEKIDELDLKTDSDFEQARKLMGRFAEYGEAVSQEIVALSKQLQEARARAEAAAKIVAAKAELLQSRNDVESQKMTAFRALAAKVNALNEGIQDLRRPEGEVLSDADRAVILSRFTELEAQLQPLIDEAQTLKREARESKLKNLEQQAESMAASLIHLKAKLAALTVSSEPVH